MIPMLMLLSLVGQDPVLTGANIDDFLEAQVEAAQGGLPEVDMEGNRLVEVSLSGRTVIHHWDTPTELSTPAVARLDRALLTACDDPVMTAATALGVRLLHVYARDDGNARPMELAADTCGGVRVSSSRYWHTIQATPTRLQAVDLRSVVEGGETLTFEFVDARPPTKDSPDLGFQITGYRLDCTARTFARLYTEYFDRQGESLDFDDQARALGPINPGTVMEAVEEEICDYVAPDDDERTLDALLQAAWARFDAAGS